MNRIAKFIKFTFPLMLIFSAVSCTPPPKEEPPPVADIDLPILAPDTSMVRDLHADAICSQTELGTVEANIFWRSESRFLDKQRLDVTIYKGGFERSSYTILWPMKVNQKFQTSKLVRLPDRPDQHYLYLDAMDISIDKQQGLVSLRLAGLRPGLDYFLRVCTLDDEGWIPGGFFFLETPLCPADVVGKPR